MHYTFHMVAFQNATPCWQGGGNCILGRTRRYCVRLSSKEKYNNRCVLCKFARTAIHEKRRGKLSKGILLQQDNARVHTCKIAMDAIERNAYKQIPQPAYSPDLAPSDYFLFPNLKKDICGRHFWSNEEVPGWSGGAKVLCILHHWCVQLIVAYSWARPAILVVGKGRGGMFLFLLFLHFHSCSSFFPVPLFHLLYSLFYLFSPFLWEKTQNDPQGLTCR